MPKRYYAQRKHIISSLDGLLYQLHALSFFVSPSIWTLVLRLLVQQQCTRTREIDPGRSLRFYFGLIVLFNGYGFWSHAANGVVQGRTVILDFVGMPYVPSKLQLLMLDSVIIFLQMLLATITFEVHIFENSNEEDTLLPSPHSPTLLITSNDILGMPERAKASEAPYIIDLTLSQVFRRLRQSSTPTTTTSRESALPLPNTTPWSMSMSIMRARAQSRRDGAAVPATATIGSRSLPGGLESEMGG